MQLQDIEFVMLRNSPHFVEPEGSLLIKLSFTNTCTLNIYTNLYSLLSYIKNIKTLLDALRHVSILYGSSSGSSFSYPCRVADVKMLEYLKL
jgi:hypothetical protein